MSGFKRHCRTSCPALVNGRATLKLLLGVTIFLHLLSCTSKRSDLEVYYSERDELAETVPDIVPTTYPLTCSQPTSGHDPNGVHNLGGSPHFEGWYYRAFDPESRQSWVLIAAYWVEDNYEGNGFLELIQHPEGTVYKQEFSSVNIEEIQASQGEFDLRLGDVQLGANKIDGVMWTDDGQRLEIDLEITDCAQWGAPDDDNNRWTMGWSTEAPGIPIRWHVHHLKANMSGTIRTPEHEWTLSEIPLHQEKNWGRSFPSSWMWLQSNHFEGRPDVAFAAAGGPIFPWRFTPHGYMAGLRWRDQFFTWRTHDTHTFPEAEFWIDHERRLAIWRLVGENYRHRIEVSVEVPLHELILIDIPSDNGLHVGAVEHLAATTFVTLYRRHGFSWKWMDTMVSSAAAVEVGGDWARTAGLIP